VRIRVVTALLAAVVGVAAWPPGASAEGSGVQHLRYRFGPVAIRPGQNAIEFSVTELKPRIDGSIVGFRPDLRRADGSVPPVDVIHLHHGVWLNLSRAAAASFGPERLFAAGEEKTILRTPPGYGYPYRASDRWLLNYMIHNLTPTPDRVWITWDLDFIPKRSPRARGIRPVRPIWMDVRDDDVYPVFDVLRRSGRRGRFTYPDQSTNPYPDGNQRNLWRVDRDGVLVGTAGHLHPGGLWTDLSVTRSGAGAAAAGRIARCRATRGPSACPSVRADTAHLFRSRARYFEPAGAVSWDVAMTATRRDWRVRVRQGDILAVSATYDSRRGSWYEAMGIMVVWMADSGPGADPFLAKVDRPGRVTHGHLPENDNHGGAGFGLPDPLALSDAPPATGPIGIRDFLYGQGDLHATGAAGRPPVVRQGQPLTFLSGDGSRGIYHTITSCRAPCNRATGIAYPLANGPVTYDSGELGLGGAPTANRESWSTPANLPPGTYTYFCRIHPFMRGAFRVR
jgi:hypothetical protein